MRRRSFVKAAAAGLALSSCRSETVQSKAGQPETTPMPTLDIRPLSFPFATDDPFLFCAYHNDRYPQGNAQMGPATSLRGRMIGQDFSGKDGWSMYHGEVVPGFPRHPHRGFETITVAREGLVDHSDSLGATARYGNGDVQWMTAGKGIVHAEMFPLLESDRDNPLDLFQIWLNLPARSKMTEPYFTMLWSEQIPQHHFEDKDGRKTTVTTIAGVLEGAAVPKPPPESWASQPEADVVVWTIDLEPGAAWTLPAGPSTSNRSLYFYRGDTLSVAGQTVPVSRQIKVQADAPLTLQAGAEKAQILLLQGRPIGEPVASYGPFVMNRPEEIQQAFHDYQRTGFGGWPWGEDFPVHAREQGRFAIHVDGRREVPT